MKGLVTALVTPFDDKGVDEDALERLVERQIAAGVDGVVVGTLAGEGPTLDVHERAQLVRCAVTVAAGRIPILAATGTNCTRATMGLTQDAAEVGASGAVVTTPYYCRPSQEGLFRHFEAVARAGLPVIIHNAPGRTAVDLLTDTLERLADVPGIAGLLDEQSDPVRLLENAQTCSGRLVRVAAGEQAPFAFHLPPDACLSVAANLVPATCRGAWVERLAGHAGRRSAGFTKLCRALDLEPSAATLKHGLSLVDERFAARTRLPLTPVGAATATAIARALAELAGADQC